MIYHRGAVGDLTLSRGLQVDHERFAVEVGDYEVRQQARVGATGADDLDGGLGVLGYLGQAAAVELAPLDILPLLKAGDSSYDADGSSS